MKSDEQEQVTPTHSASQRVIPKPFLSGLGSKVQMELEPSTPAVDFFHVPTLDLETDPEEDSEEFHRRRQIRFKYFGR